MEKVPPWASLRFRGFHHDVRTPDATRSLRKLTEDDGDNFFLMDNDDDVLKYTSETSLESIYAYKLKLRETYLPFYDRHANFGFWAAEERVSGSFIGWFCLHPAVEAGEAASLLKFGDDDFEIGYRLRRYAWGKGYATEVTRALVTWAFSELGVKSIVATTSSANLASIRVCWKRQGYAWWTDYFHCLGRKSLT